VRQKSKKRVEAQRLWEDSGRQAKLKDIADQLGVPDGQVRKWKCMDKWDASPAACVPESKRNVAKSPSKVTDISTRRRQDGQPPAKPKAGQGGPPGNKHAVGHGAPEGNANAVKHGLYQAIANMYFDEADRDLFEAAGAAAGIESELRIARFKLARLMREQERRNQRKLQGTMGSGFGPVAYNLKDDFYEDAINKTLTIIARLEKQLQKARIEQERLELAKRQLAILETRYGEGGDDLPDDHFLEALNAAAVGVWAGEKTGGEKDNEQPGCGDS
jgi:hypothetical protein